MKYKEYGKGNRKTIVLLHGGGLSWWNYREAAKLLQGDYHVILPILDGHSGSAGLPSTIASSCTNHPRISYSAFNMDVLFEAYFCILINEKANIGRLL